MHNAMSHTDCMKYVAHNAMSHTCHCVKYDNMWRIMLCHICMKYVEHIQIV